MTSLQKKAKSTGAYPGHFTPLPATWDDALGSIRKSLWGIREGADRIEDSDDDLRLLFFLPGFRHEDILVKVREGQLQVTALRKEPVHAHDPAATAYETISTSRMLMLPENIDTDFASAEYKNGTLVLVFPKVKCQERATLHRLVIY